MAYFIFFIFLILGTSYRSLSSSLDTDRNARCTFQSNTRSCVILYGPYPFRVAHSTKSYQPDAFMSFSVVRFKAISF